MTNYEILSCVIASIAMAITGIAAFFTYRNLREIRKQFFEQNRGNLVFYIRKGQQDKITDLLVIKNFGNSPAKLLSLKITPELDWKKSKHPLPDKCNITNCKNVFIAPKYYISSSFNFRGYPDKIFEVELHYQTCGKEIKEQYIIDMNYASSLVETIPDIRDELEGLKAINNSIRQLSDRLL